MPNWKKVIVSGSDASLTSLNVINGVTGSLFGTSSWAQNAITSSYILNAVSASYAFNSTTASYALTASFALNGGGGGGVTASNLYTHSQASPAVTWSINHNLDSSYPIINVYDETNAITIPGDIRITDNNNLKIYFTYPSTGTATIIGNALISNATAANAVSASYALTASFALNGGGGGGGLQTKAGSVANSSFGGSPLSASIIFSTAFPNTNYAITVTGEDARSWTIENKLSGSFIINSNSSVGLTGNTYWTATAYGESA
jgi:hypothetical protein